jgi:hypothetical protein
MDFDGFLHMLKAGSMDSLEQYLHPQTGCCLTVACMIPRAAAVYAASMPAGPPHMVQQQQPHRVCGGRAVAAPMMMTLHGPSRRSTFDLTLVPAFMVTGCHRQQAQRGNQRRAVHTILHSNVTAAAQRNTRRWLPLRHPTTTGA